MQWEKLDAEVVTKRKYSLLNLVAFTAVRLPIPWNICLQFPFFVAARG